MPYYVCLPSISERAAGEFVPVRAEAVATRTDKDFSSQSGSRDYGGVHCGEVFEFCLNDVWVPARVEMGMDGKWYLVGLPELQLDGLEVRQG